MKWILPQQRVNKKDGATKKANMKSKEFTLVDIEIVIRNGRYDKVT